MLSQYNQLVDSIEVPWGTTTIRGRASFKHFYDLWHDNFQSSGVLRYNCTQQEKEEASKKAYADVWGGTRK